MFGFMDRRLVRCLLAGIAALGLLAAPSAADEPLREKTSLAFIPADAAFYTAYLHNRAQWDAFMNSRAIARLKAMPVMQIAGGLIEQQKIDPEGPWAKFEAWRAQEENAELLELLADMVADEIFVYGDGEFGEFTTLYAQIQAAQQISAVGDLVNKGGEAAPDPAASQRQQQRAVLKVLDEYRDDLPVPAMTIGFRITDAARAESQIARLEKLLQSELAKEDEAGRLKRTSVAGTSFLVLNLDGKLLKKAGMDLSTLEEEEGEFAELAKALEKQPVTLALGVRGDYLLFGLGDTTEFLVPKKNADLLIDRDEFEPVREHADKTITSVTWISPEYAENVATPGEQLKNLLPLAEAGVENAKIDEDLKEELQADLEKLFAKLQKSLPEPAAALSFTFWTDRGFEGYDYSWAENPLLDASKKLTLLEHVGGDPIGFSVSRTVSDPADYDAFVAFLKRAFYYFEELGLEELTAEQQAEYEKYRDALLPLLERVDVTTREKLIPALEDGQCGLVLDAKLKNKQWSPTLPAAAEPLPMIEFAILCGVSDAKLLREAFVEYHAVAQAIADKLHEFEPEKVPEITIPVPTSRKVAGGTIYQYDVDEQVPVSEDLAPNAGLSEKVAILSFAPATTSRLLTATPLKSSEGPLAAAGKPLASAGQFRFNALIAALVPWVNYGFDAAAAQDPNAGGQLEPYRSQILDLLDILQCYRGSASVRYVDDDVWVRHRESHWQDLPE